MAPRNGWIADYPVTPDIVGELQSAVSEAADSGKLAMGKDEALKAFQRIITDYNLILNADTSGQDTGDTSGTEYPDSTVVNNYYYDEGPPVVTYYAPPPDYSYLYTWVPYPFWWWDFWFPGFFVLVDFDVRVHGHERGHGHDRGHERGHDFVSNHFRDPSTGQMARIDPAHRSRGGTLPASGGARWTGPSAQSGAKAIISNGRTSAGRGRTGTGAYKEFRGYGVTRPSAGTRSSAFERSVNRGVEKSASDRGFQSRSNAGQISPKASGGGGGGVSRGGGGGFHGGGRR